MLRLGLPTMEGVRVTGDALMSAWKESATVKPKFWKNEALANPGAWSAENLGRMKQGKASIGGDGFPMALHLKVTVGVGGSNAFGKLVPVTRSDHRLGHSYKLIHPNVP